MDLGGGSWLDVAVDGAEAVVVVVGALDLEGQARLSGIAEMMSGLSSGGGHLKRGRFDGERGHGASSDWALEWMELWWSRLSDECLLEVM